MVRLPPPLNATTEAEVCAVVRGHALHPTDPERFVDLAISEGLGPLVWRSPARPELPPAALAAVQEEVRRQLALAAVRDAELRRVLRTLVASGVDALLVKGAHVAHAFYPDPALRPRNDTDLLVRPGHESRTEAALEALGYERQPAITGVSVQGQTIYDRDDVIGAVLDVHWRLASPIVAANLFNFSELWHRSQPVQRCGDGARAPHLLDAITIAAVHLVAHHPHERGLLWLHDLHVLANSLDEAALATLATEAPSRRVSSILVSALQRAHGCFPSAAIDRVLERLESDATEPSAALLHPRVPSEAALMDVRALRSWRARTAYVAGHLFPPSDYMRRRYAPDSHAPLPWLYTTRILRGATKWLGIRG